MAGYYRYSARKVRQRIRAPLLASISLGRFTAVTDVADAACFLASDEASYMTTTLMEVDGGRFI